MHAEANFDFPIANNYIRRLDYQVRWKRWAPSCTSLLFAGIVCTETLVMCDSRIHWSARLSSRLVSVSPRTNNWVAYCLRFTTRHKISRQSLKSSDPGLCKSSGCPAFAVLSSGYGCYQRMFSFADLHWKDSSNTDHNILTTSNACAPQTISVAAPRFNTI